MLSESYFQINSCRGHSTSSLSSPSLILPAGPHTSLFCLSSKPSVRCHASLSPQLTVSHLHYSPLVPVTSQVLLWEPKSNSLNLSTPSPPNLLQTLPLTVCQEPMFLKYPVFLKYLFQSSFEHPRKDYSDVTKPLKLCSPQHNHTQVSDVPPINLI